jgi:hypothetical protein
MPRIYKKKNNNKKGIKTYKKNRKNNHKKTYKNKTKHLPIVYGKLHMTECMHCQMLVSEWNIVTEKMKIHIDVICHDIERKEESTQLSLFNNKYKPYKPLQIQGGYPTIYKLHKRRGNITYYSGPRDNQSILQWLQG